MSPLERALARTHLDPFDAQSFVRAFHEAVTDVRTGGDIEGHYQLLRGRRSSAAAEAGYIEGLASLRPQTAVRRCTS